MNELRRMAYLEALGVDGYVSRSQLPGAAQSRRLAVVTPTSRTAQGNPPGLPDATENPLPWDTLAGAAANARVRPAAAAANSRPVRAQPRRQGESLPRFSLAAIVAGDWLWLEALEDMPLATEQVWLVKAMAQALAACAAYSEDEDAAGGSLDPVQTDVAQFDWPIHTNQQLDLGEEAARASVAGFIGRKLQQHQCRGLVLLGQPCQKWVAVEQLQVRNVATLSSALILARPELKREAWRDLLPLLQHV